MAIRSNRPSWDMDIREIEARASRLKSFDREYFARQQPQQAVRADAASSSRAADDAVFDALCKTLPPEAQRDLVLAYSRAAERGESLDLAGFVRADAANVSVSDGLRMIVRHDDTGREIRTFENTGKYKKWMDKFKALPEEQVMLNEKNIPPDQFDAVEAKWRASRALKEQAARAVAEGKPVYCDLTYDYQDLQG